LAAVLVAAALLVGCSAPERGTVVAKRYEPEYTTTTWTCYGYDKNGFCTLQLPTSNRWPEQWQLRLRDGDDEGWRAVDQADYHEYEVGEEYP